jgi:N-acetylglucosamine-6-phosphate deacetylase
MTRTVFINGTLIRPDRLHETSLTIEGWKITGFGESPKPGDAVVDCRGYFVSPGFVDIHVHGGGGADFMDLTPKAFEKVCQTHARHGTTSLTPTSTVATAEDYAHFLTLCREYQRQSTGGARVIGAHHYGPYFFPPARGCHPRLDYQTPDEAHIDAFDGYSKAFPCSVTIAPELANAEVLTRACVQRGLVVNIGHSHATFEQVEAAVQWGATHVDHLFCAMSDRARLRQTQPFPMRGGVLEATLALRELTTEVIADGHHLADSLLKTAYKIKGADKLALVTDSMRAVDCPDGEYWFGPAGRGELIRRRGDVGVTLDGSALASGVLGLDDAVRVMRRATGAPLFEVIRMASLTPARIIGLDATLGSIDLGKSADLAIFNEAIDIQSVWLSGAKLLL